MAILFYIIAEGTISTGFRKDLYDEEILQLLARNLIYASYNSIFDIVRRCLPMRWKTTDDVVYPYGDGRQCLFNTVWTLDVAKDRLHFDKVDRSGYIPLPLIRERLVSFDDSIPSEKPSAPIFPLKQDFPPLYWNPIVCVQQRNKAFAQRVLSDFNGQWRHILRSRYNDLTFRKLARSVLRIATFDFQIKELIGRKPGLGGPVVFPSDLPRWEPLPMQIVRFGRTWVVASQNPADSISLIREHLATQHHEQEDSHEIYLILSVRYVILVRVREGELEWTSPEPFLDGTNLISDRALDLLLWALATDPPPTPLSRLPLEIQNRVLRYVSQGFVEAARVGCILGLGSPFLWKDGNMTIEIETAYRHRIDGTPVESQIYFDDHCSGIHYQARPEPMKLHWPVSCIAEAET